MAIGLLVRCIIRGASALTFFVLRRHQRRKEMKRLEIEFLRGKMAESLIFFQQGLEIFTECLSTMDENWMDDEDRTKWDNLIQVVIKASSMASFTQLPQVCFALRDVIPFLTRIKDKINPGNPNIVRAKEAFQCSSLFASAIFQSTEVTSFMHVFFYSLATAMKVNAAVMQCLTSPELLATVVIGHIEQLQQFSPILEKIFLKEKSRKNTAIKSITMICVGQLFVLGVSLLPLCRAQDREKFLNKLRVCHASSLSSLIEKNSVVSQMSIRQQGINDGDLDGPTSVVVNSEGLVIIADSRNQRVKAVADDGTFLWQCQMPQSEHLTGSYIPIFVATNQHDEIFAILCKESTKVYTIVKFDPNGRYLCSYDTRHCSVDLGQGVVLCGMSVSSRGLIYVGDASNGCIHVLEPDETTLSTRNIIGNSDLLHGFSFCLGPNEQIVVATRGRVLIFHEDGKFQKKVTLKHKQNKVKKWNPLAMAYDKYGGNVLIVTAGEITEATSCMSSKTVHVKPMVWFLSQSYDLERALEFPLDDLDSTNGRFAMAAGKGGLWCVTEATHGVHCLKLTHHIINP